MDKKNATEIFNLGFHLAKTNFKLRNEGSYLGIFWYLLSPLSLFLVLIFISRFIGINSQDYPAYLLSGLIVFNFFSNSIIQAANIMNYNSYIIKSIKIPHESLVLSTIFQIIFSHFFEVILLAIVMIFYKFSLAGLIFYPLIFIFFVIFSLGIGFFLSTLGVFVNDLNNILSVLLTLLWFTSPIFYFIEKGSLLYKFNLFNPFYYFITITREIVIYQRAPSLWMMVVLVILSALFLAVGFSIFEKYKNKFAELV